MKSPCEALAMHNNKRLGDVGKDIVSLRLPTDDSTWTRAILAIDLGTLLWTFVVKDF